MIISETHTQNLFSYWRYCWQIVCHHNKNSTYHGTLPNVGMTKILELDADPRCHQNNCDKLSLHNQL